MGQGAVVGVEVDSKWGKKNGLPGYDRFRTGLTYRDVWEMFRDDNDDRTEWKHKRRHTILGHWHEIKLQLYHQAMDMAGEGYTNHAEMDEALEG